MTIPLLAQSAISSIEIIGGQAHSYFRGINIPNEQVKNLSLLGGLGITHSISGHIEGNAMIFLEQKGFKQDLIQTFFDKNSNATTSRYVRGTKLSYTTMQTTLRILIGKKNHFFVGLGGYFSLLQKAAYYSEKYALNGLQISYHHTDVFSAYRNYDFGVSSTFGYQKKIAPNIYAISQLRFNLGLIDIRSLSTSAVSYKNNVISFLLGFKFKLKSNENYLLHEE